MPSIFLETSALLAEVLGEPKGVFVKAKLKRAKRIIASRLIQVEAGRALLRIENDGAVPPLLVADLRRRLAAILPCLDLVELSKDICDLAAHVAPTRPLRSLDAIHLATYYKVREHDAEIRLLSLDQRLLDALS
jgi:predicted nucleic acid-binding protein